MLNIVQILPDNRRGGEGIRPQWSGSSLSSPSHSGAAAQLEVKITLKSQVVKKVKKPSTVNLQPPQ